MNGDRRVIIDALISRGLAKDLENNPLFSLFEFSQKWVDGLVDYDAV